MFKFNFSDGSDEEEPTIAKKSKSDSHENLSEKEVFDFKEIMIYETQMKEKLNFKKYKVTNDLYIECIDSSLLFENNVINEGNAFAANQQNSDLLPSIYEGGMEVWECTKDMLVYFIDLNVNFKTTSVLDLGCGHGLLGIYAMMNSASSVHFQDYNEEVLTNTTIRNVQRVVEKEQCDTKESEKSFKNISDNKEGKKSSGREKEVDEKVDLRFFAGDWSKFHSNFSYKYDYILSSETIYNASNYRRLHNVCHKFLKANGTCVIAAKTHYFGVGGGTRDFEGFVHKNEVFDSKVVRVFSKGGVQREILQLKFKDCHVNADVNTQLTATNK